MDSLWHDPFVLFWTAMVFTSVAWYAYLLFHVGWRGGRDIVRMARDLAEQQNGASE